MKWIFLILGRVATCDFPQQTTFGCSLVPTGPRNSVRWFASENYSEQPFPKFGKPAPYLCFRLRVSHSFIQWIFLLRMEYSLNQGIFLLRIEYSLNEGIILLFFNCLFNWSQGGDWSTQRASYCTAVDQNFNIKKLIFQFQHMSWCWRWYALVYRCLYSWPVEETTGIVKSLRELRSMSSILNIHYV